MKIFINTILSFSSLAIKRPLFSTLCFALLLAIGTGAFACRGPAGKTDSEAKTYNIEGKVTSIDKAGNRLTIYHGAIPGYMDEAMTMPYPLKDQKSYDALEVGDTIKAKLVVMSDSREWLEDVVVSKKQSGPAADKNDKASPSDHH
ncbi:MAG TPA: copper-binding protein [Blastocatellia bacterium]|nr:copper-binding protein [Blastocatellia bacterium]